MTRLILVRHGQTASNVAGLLDTGLPGPGLTDLGRQQAAALVDRLAGERIEVVVASPLARTVETAGPLTQALGLRLNQDAGLREILAGDLEGRSDRADHLAYLGAAFAWARGETGPRIAGSPEDGADFLARVDAAVEAATGGVDGAVVCVSHGATIRTWATARAANLPGDWSVEHGLPNTGVVVLEREAGGPWRAVTWQDERVGDLSSDPTGAPVAP